MYNGYKERGEENMKYRCLILDHDDTVVQSTPEIHYPSFLEALSILRPEMPALSLQQFISYCFNPGFSELCIDIMKFTSEEQQQQYQIWKKYTETRIPDFYPGIAEFLQDYKNTGGIITVVSHSESQQILRDYQTKCKLTPELIFGWELAEHQRKPYPYPVREILKCFNLKEDEVLVLDDLKPGLVMARSCGVTFASAGWSHTIPAIKEYMTANSDYYFSTVASLRKFILND